MTPDKNYDHRGHFFYGIARVCANGKWGYINEQGQPITPIKYDKASTFFRGYGVVKFGAERFLINRYGKRIRTNATIVSVCDDILIVKNRSGRYALYNIITNKLLTKFQYTHIFSANDGWFAVELGDCWGYVDSEGKMVVENQFDAVKPFYEGLAVVGKFCIKQWKYIWGYINKEGEQVIPLRYGKAYDFSEGLAAVKLGQKFGYINPQGELVIDFKFDEGAYFRNGKIRIWKNDQPRFINRRGELLVNNGQTQVWIPSKYHEARDFSEGIAAVQIENRWGYIDCNLKEITPMKYSMAKDFIDGFGIVKLNGKLHFVDREGNELPPPSSFWSELYERI